MGMALTAAEAAFIEQRHEFLELARERYPDAPQSLEALLSVPCRPADALVVDRLDPLAEGEAAAIADPLLTGDGLSHVVPVEFTAHRAGGDHVVLGLAASLAEHLPLRHPVDHPLEGHPEALDLFGPSDGTLKIYDVPRSDDGPQPRVEADAIEMFAAHNDGLGLAGSIHHVLFTMESAPLTGGYNFFQNLVRSSIALAMSDPEAFAALFLPDAITAVRPHGNSSIKVTTPVLFLGPDGGPQCFFRVDTGGVDTDEYRMRWRPSAPLQRAQELLHRLTAPFAASSRFVHLVRPGETIVIDNRHVVHGRTAFVAEPGTRGRVLARKWFVAEPGHREPRLVPGVAVDARYADHFPEIFGSERLSGDWSYDAASDLNVRR